MTVITLELIIAAGKFLDEQRIPKDGRYIRYRDSVTGEIIEELLNDTGNREVVTEFR